MDVRVRGTCRALYCLDVGRSIDLRLAEETLSSSQRTRFEHKSRTPVGAGGMEPPLRLVWNAPRTTVEAHESEPSVEVSLYDFGGLCVTWSLPFEGSLDELVALSSGLYEHPELGARSRTLAEEVSTALGPSLERPALAPLLEDYVVFELSAGGPTPADLEGPARENLARLLRAEVGGLSSQEVEDALAHPVSYGPGDLCLVDWRGAVLAGQDTEDERRVLELATVELLELRLLDLQLDRGIDQAYELLARRKGLPLPWKRAHEVEQVALMQADGAALFEGIDNALKLLGDDYLARLYRTAARRFHFDDWDAAIERRLGVLRSVHQSLAELSAHRRSESLEWIIIVLIAVDIAVYFFTPLHG